MDGITSGMMPATPINPGLQMGSKELPPPPSAQSVSPAADRFEASAGIELFQQQNLYTIEGEILPSSASAPNSRKKRSANENSLLREGEDLKTLKDRLVIEQMYGVKTEEESSVDKPIDGASAAPEISFTINSENEQSSDFQQQVWLNSQSFRDNSRREAIEARDPLILDLDGNGISFDRNGTTTFDLNGDGTKEKIHSLRSGSAYLALDRNANGQIDSGKELFGDQNGAANGFLELKKYDDNGDNVIDSKDRVFNRLLLFRNDGKVTSFARTGQESISLNFSKSNQSGFFGQKTAASAYSDGTGNRREIANFLLNTVG